MNHITPNSSNVVRIKCIDSHTEGEPTRVVVSGGPDLGTGTVATKLELFRRQFDTFRSAIVNEPRGNNAMVGALVLPPTKQENVCGVIFFNNVGFLHSCGHGTIGLAATLAYMGQIGPGRHTIETPVGEVSVAISDQGLICLDNVASYVHASNVPLEFMFEGVAQRVSGDISWGGNWFFLTEQSPIPIVAANIDRLTAFAIAIRIALEQRSICGARGEPIDHIELCGAAVRDGCDSKNFVLCPGNAYDRSPCGTGTSARLVSLLAAGKLTLGQKWRQESIIGSAFTGWLRKDGEAYIPSITGNAYVCGETTLLLDPADPFVHGIRL